MLVSELVPLIKQTLKPKEISLFSNILTVYGYTSHDSNVLEFYTKIAENFEWFADKSKIPAAWRASSARTNYQILTKVLTVCEELQTQLGSELVERIKININKYRSILAKQKDEQPKPAPKQVQVQVLKDDESENESDVEEPVAEPVVMSDVMTTKVYYLQEENKSLQKKLQKQIEICKSQLDTQKKLMDIIKEQEELIRTLMD